MNKSPKTQDIVKGKEANNTAVVATYIVRLSVPGKSSLDVHPMETLVNASELKRSGPAEINGRPISHQGCVAAFYWLYLGESPPRI